MARKSTSMFGEEARQYGLNKKDGASKPRPAATQLRPQAQPVQPTANSYRPGTPTPPPATNTYEVPTGGKQKAPGLRGAVPVLSFMLTVWGTLTLLSFKSIGPALVLLAAGFVTSIVGIAVTRGYKGKGPAIASLLLAGFFLFGSAWAVFSAFAT